jgi:hypothetical protein
MALIGYALARGRASRSEFSRPAKRSPHAMQPVRVATFEASKPRALAQRTTVQGREPWTVSRFPHGTLPEDGRLGPLITFC